ncbi:unnamed protein product [Timema podura]|uniref:Uncharacterized protein n=1 Tax=Timema podura TaxID=61482 RepID=A0ABN7NNB5_TIMPD|nr:unnamed protein product [Timema podura]
MTVRSYIILSDARDLKEFPNLNGTSALEFLRLDRASINYVPPSLCRFCPRLKSLDLKVNKLTTIPDLTFCRELRVLDLAHNKITELEGRPFKNLSLLHDLLLSHNSISNIPREAFIGLKRLQFLASLLGEVFHIIELDPQLFASALVLKCS